MATVTWGIPEAAVAILEKHGARVDNAIVTDIEYGEKGDVQRVFAEPTPQAETQPAHPGTPDTVTD